MSAVTVNDDGLVLRLYIQPKASRDSIVGLHGDEVKVAITAPPVDGQANSHLVKFLGKQFRVAKSQVVIEKGELGRHKQIKIINPQQIRQKSRRIIRYPMQKLSSQPAMPVKCVSWRRCLATSVLISWAQNRPRRRFR